MTDLPDNPTADEEGNEDNQDWDENYFPVAAEYAHLVVRLAASIDLLLNHKNLSLQAVSTLARLKHSLLRIPARTEGVAFELDLTTSKSDDGCSASMSLRLSESSFMIDYNEYVMGPCGGDREWSTVYECENTGSRIDEIEDPATILIRWEDWLEAWEKACQDPSTEVDVGDSEDTYDWSDPEGESAWRKMPTNY